MVLALQVAIRNGDIGITGKINYALNLDEEITDNNINNFFVNEGCDSQTDGNTIQFYRNNKLNDTSLFSLEVLTTADIHKHKNN